MGTGGGETAADIGLGREFKLFAAGYAVVFEAVAVDSFEDRGGSREKSFERV